MRKITVNLPVDLLSSAQKWSGQSISEILRNGLKLVTEKEASKRLATYQGKIKIKLRKWSEFGLLKVAGDVFYGRVAAGHIRCCLMDLDMDFFGNVIE